MQSKAELSEGAHTRCTALRCTKTPCACLGVACTRHARSCSSWAPSSGKTGSGDVSVWSHIMPCVMQPRSLAMLVPVGLLAGATPGIAKGFGDGVRWCDLLSCRTLLSQACTALPPSQTALGRWPPSPGCSSTGPMHWRCCQTPLGVWAASRTSTSPTATSKSQTRGGP